MEASARRVAPRHLSDYLQAHGRPIVSLNEVAELTDLPSKAAADAMVRLRRANQMFSPARGLYVAVPPQYRTWGVVPALDFIDAMMAALRRRYYVALLSAAELHGASHQRPQVFQVMVDRPVANRDLGRIHLRFYTRVNLSAVPTILRNTTAGHVRVATPAATCLDLATRPNVAGGLSNVATILAELVDEAGLNANDLLAAAAVFPVASLRRLGWLLEHTGSNLNHELLTAALAERAAGERPTTLLDPSGPRRGRGDHRWGIVENTEVAPDL